MNDGPQREMPKYQSRWIVHALKIRVITLEPGGGATITPDDRGYGQFHVDHAYMDKYKPEIKGYYVRYPDGYESWSPARAFEIGFTRIESDEPSP